MKNESAWPAEAEQPTFGKLKGHVEVDALIVGGGITGVTAASLLKESGRTVALVDLHKIGGGETAHTTAHVTYVTDARLNELVAHLGKNEAQALWQAGELAMQQIELLVRKYGIECSLRRVPGYLCAAKNRPIEKQIESLKQDAKLAAEMGLDAAFVDHSPIFGRPAVRFANQLKFHPLKYLFGLASTLPGEGCHVYEETDGTKLDEEKRELQAPSGTIGYQNLIIATHVPIQGKRGTISAALFQTKLAGYSSYAIEAGIGASDEAMLWDTNDPYLYLRLDRREDGNGSVIIGGEDHKTGQEPDTEARYAKLEGKLMELFPEAKPRRRWSGQVIETPDGLPYIGETGQGQYLATGFSGNGMTLGTFSGMLIRDLILGNENPWAGLFDPHRKRLAGTWEYLRENKDFPACYLRDHLTPAHGSIEDVAPGHGDIVKVDGHKCAVYCDEHGHTTILSAVCPHLGCIVGWNEAEKSWDCPCHGSRFTAKGDVFAGPAETGLEKQPAHAT